MRPQNRMDTGVGPIIRRFRPTSKRKCGTKPNAIRVARVRRPAPSSEPKSQPVFLRQRSAIFDRIVTARPTQPRRADPVAQLDYVHSVLRLNYETLKGLISLASPSVAKTTLCETEVRASQSEPICLSRARGRRVACLKVPALGSGARTAIDTPRSVYLRPRST